jgi:hypothetical protein
MSGRDELVDEASRIVRLLLNAIKGYQEVTGASRENTALMISTKSRLQIRTFLGVPVYRSTRLEPGAIFVTQPDLARFIVSHERAAVARWN